MEVFLDGDDAEEGEAGEDAARLVVLMNLVASDEEPVSWDADRRTPAT